MKKEMIIIKMALINDKTMEIGLIPIIEEKNKVSLMDIAFKKDLKQIINEVQTQKQKLMDIIYLPSDWCNKNNLNLFKKISIEIS